MILDTGIDIISSQFSKLGKEKMSQLYPRDFEVYMCALELVDDNLFPVDYFAFPVMPRSITKTESESTTIQHSFNGITVFNKKGFIPDELNIQGDFGRSFKIMSPIKGVEEEYASFRGVRVSPSIENGYYRSEDVNNDDNISVKTTLPYGVKTGFGCINILKSIVSKAKAHGDTGKTYKLYFYNPALGENYLVVPAKNPLVLSQTEQSSNMVWQYTLNLIIIADLEDVEYRNKNDKHMQYSFTADQILGNITTLQSLSMSYSNLNLSKR